MRSHPGVLSAPPGYRPHEEPDQWPVSFHGEPLQLTELPFLFKTGKMTVPLPFGRRKIVSPSQERLPQMPDCFIAIDAGTTNSRAWLVGHGAVLAAASVPVGVRDSARDGHPGALHRAIRDLVAQVSVQATTPPTLIAAAGMITSALGLKEVVHQMAPAGPTELAAAAVEFRLPEISELPIVLFPGVRSGAWFAEEDIESNDMMRGEETLCIGLARQRPGQALTVLNLGSHWKAIQVDARGSITGSWTSLSGEMLHAVMSQTILASAVPSGRPEVADPEWVQRGAEMLARHGLSRTLFAVRLWEVQGRARSSAEQRLAFLVGAFAAEGLDVFRRAGYLTRGPVLLIGSGGIAEAWQLQLEQAGIEVERIDTEATTRAFIDGIQRLLDERSAANRCL
jgi:2-dehydro-3-deoxygalactonokinase